MNILQDIKLAPVKKTNIPFVAELYKQEIGSNWSEADLLAFRSEPVNDLYEIRFKDRCVGFVMATTIKPESNLVNIVVEKPLQNLGIGQQALEIFIKKLKRSKVTMLHLEVRQHSPAVRFYLRQGFVPTGQRKGYYSDGETAILMTKTI
jgi:ribosomal-protein-alanine N-acetyltransferase